MVAAPRTVTVTSPILQKALSGHGRLLMDGGMGTLIQGAGLAGIHAVPDLLNLTHPDAVGRLQRRYVEAGADCITTNTFNANRLKLEGTGVSVAEVYAAAVAVARGAGAELVAGDIGPTGALMQPIGALSFDDAYDVFAEQARAAEAAGCDLVVVETFSDLLEAKAALLACLETTALPVFCTMTFGEDGRTFMGTTPAIAAATLSALGANAVGLNCSLGPAELAGLVQEMAPFARCPLMVQPNAGLPRVNEVGDTVFDVGPNEFCRAMEPIVQSGVVVIGGCCGTTPEHIARLRQLLQDTDNPEEPVRYRPSFVVTSAQAMVELAEGSRAIAVIGERINPTGKKRLKAALLAGDYDAVVAEAVAQVAADADILDVNVGVPGLDEPAVLQAVAQRLQATVTAPLQLDSSNPAALAAACRTYAGRPLVNSVNGKAESLKAVLPVAARYGATVLGLTLDEGGIPPTAEGRFAIAKRIVEAAEAAGIPREDVAIDCLVMAAATNQGEIPEILQAVRLCKQRLGVRTVLGVSNVSFGLPRRAVLNATFLAAALAAGLDMPILNPLEARYQDAVRSFKVINGQDAVCAQYVEAYAGTQEAAPVMRAAAPDVVAAPGQHDGFVVDSPDGSALYRAVLTGRAAAAAEAATAALQQQDPIAIASTVLSPALDEVGRRYDNGEYFLPQLMAAAEAAKAAFDVLAEANGPAPVASQGAPIVIATVEGDIHDIGKNIVKMLLENYGFPVCDLGRDVAPRAIVDAVRETGARLVGLSALMTTTVGAMERTISLLRHETPGVSVMVGGAVLTADYAESIGADYYVEDAAASVKVAQRLL